MNVDLSIKDTDEKVSTENVSTDKLEVCDIFKKTQYYTDLFSKLQMINTIYKKSVMKYTARLNVINMFIQMSIITLSSVSTFVQTVTPVEERDDITNYILLGITTYSGLTLAFARFYKLEEKKENALGLRDRFCDLQTKIEYQTHFLRPWKNPQHYSNNTTKGIDRPTEWFSAIGKMDREYMSLIDQQTQLTGSFDKIVPKKYVRNLMKSYSYGLHNSMNRRRYCCFLCSNKLDRDEMDLYYYLEPKTIVKYFVREKKSDTYSLNDTKHHNRNEYEFGLEYRCPSSTPETQTTDSGLIFSTNLNKLSVFSITHCVNPK